METRFRACSGEWFGETFLDFSAALKDAQRWGNGAEVIAVRMPRWI